MHTIKVRLQPNGAIGWQTIIADVEQMEGEVELGALRARATRISDYRIHWAVNDVLVGRAVKCNEVNLVKRRED